MKSSLICLLALPMLALASAAAIAATECVSEGTLTTYEPPPAVSYNALYETVAGYVTLKHVKIENQQTFKLCVPGFQKPWPVRAVIQGQPAPLVVVLLGIGGRTDADFSKVWAQWYADAGYNVLTFNSTFGTDFVEAAGKGPSGNIWSEAWAVKDIIAAFLEQPEVKGQVTNIGVVGMSYGGVQALILGQFATEGKLPFKIDAIQAYSPPADMRHTARLLDDWYSRERWKYRLTELQYEVGMYKFNKAGCRGAPSQSQLEAAIAASFRDGLVSVVVKNDAKFCLGLLPNGDNFVRRDYAGTWGFETYGYDMALPWWRQQVGSDKVDNLLDAATLGSLLQHQPPGSVAIVAADDPFNTPADMAALKESKTEHLEIVPHGGHLGYISDNWTRTRLLSLFEGGGSEVSSR
jgi:predicted alpha/beta-fold hydrolase